ncbi:MAG: WG repeat-containing protein [Bacteroidota bacterium]
MRARIKDAQNPGIDYYTSLLFSTEKYSEYSLDSARVYIQLSQEKYDQATPSLKEDLAEDGVTADKIGMQDEYIRGLLYERLMENLSLQNIYDFQYVYPLSPFDSLLIYMGDSIVYERVVTSDTEADYLQFISEVKTSVFKEKAIDRLDHLRYQSLLRSKALDDYYRFLSDYPTTQFKNQIEAYILKRATAGQERESFIDFINFSSNLFLKKKAGDVVYHLDPERKLIKEHPYLDSLKVVHDLSEKQLFPVLDAGQFGFYSRNGDQAIGYEFTQINEEFKCGLTSDEWLFVSDTISKIIAKNGEIILSNIQEYTDLGHGAAKVKKNGKWFLYHKSGFLILKGAIQDAEVLNGRWIKVQRKDRWGLFSFLGYEVAPFKYENIETLGPFWIFQKNRSLAVYNKEKIRDDLDQKGLELEFRFHDVELIDQDKLIGFRENRECMLDSALNFLIPWGVYQINPDPSGWYLKSAEGYRLYNHEKEDIGDDVHPYLELNRGWLALKRKGGSWMLSAREVSAKDKTGYDSLKLISDFVAYAERKEKRQLIFSNGDSLDLMRGEKVKTFLNRPSYLLLEGSYGRKVVSITGKEVVRGNFDELTFFNDSLVKANINRKYGLIRLKGGYLIKPEYQAIDELDGLILCLINGKIGCYDLKNGNWVRAKYESRIARLGENYLVKSEGMFGVLNPSNELVIPTDYDEIRYWNDTSYLVKKEAWYFINQNNEQIGDPFDYLSELSKSGDESIFEYIKHGKYGLLSSKSGFLLEPEFTEIVNLGSSEEPLFMADQHLKTAQLHVVSYVNANGKLIMSKAYRKSDFDKLLCEDE